MAKNYTQTKDFFKELLKGLKSFSNSCLNRCLLDFTARKLRRVVMKFLKLYRRKTNSSLGQYV